MVDTKKSMLGAKLKLQKQNRTQRSNFFVAQKFKKASFTTKPRRPWLPRHLWLRRKRFLKAVAYYKHRLWLLRRERWLRRNKRPFWKRKSFRRFKAEQNMLNNLFFIHKKQFATAQVITKKWSSKKILYRRYYRSNSVKKEFKNRIILRHYWKFRYECRTHNKLNSFLLSVKKKSQRLFYFFSTFELVLFRYARWWGLIPLYCNDYLARYFVTHGYIYVNFLPEVNPMYKIKSQDCIFSVSITQLLNVYFFVPNYLRNYGKIKHLTGRKEFSKPFRKVAPPINLRFYCGKSGKKKEVRRKMFEMLKQSAAQLYLKIRSLLQVSTWAPLASLHYSLVMETSYKLKIFVSTSGYNWFTIAFGLLRTFTDTNPILVNKFISCSYY